MPALARHWIAAIPASKFERLALAFVVVFDSALLVVAIH